MLTKVKFRGGAREKMVIITNMEHLPEVCSECPCWVDIREYGEACVLCDRRHDGSAEDRIEHCPLKEVILFGQKDREDYRDGSY